MKILKGAICSLFLVQTILFAQSPIYINGNRVGINTLYPTQTLEVVGTVSANRFIGEGVSQWSTGSDASISYMGGKVFVRERVRAGQDYLMSVGAPGLWVNAQSGSNGITAYRADNLYFNINMDGTNTYMRTAATQPIVFQQGTRESFRVAADGKLQVSRQVLVGPSATSGLYLRSDAAPTHYNWKISTQERVNTGFEIASSTTVGGTTFNSPAFVILQNGNVGVGTVSPKYLLSVKGTVLAKQVLVSILASDWADDVFEPGYVLKPLNEVDAYIKKNKHLLGIKSADDLAKNHLNLAEMNAAMIRKIEELTLYIIELNNKVHQLESRLDTIAK